VPDYCLVDRGGKRTDLLGEVLENAKPVWDVLHKVAARCVQNDSALDGDERELELGVSRVRPKDCLETRLVRDLVLVLADQTFLYRGHDREVHERETLEDGLLDGLDLAVERREALRALCVEVFIEQRNVLLLQNRDAIPVAENRRGPGGVDDLIRGRKDQREEVRRQLH